MRWGHLTWPGDLTLRDLGLKFSQHVRKRCMIRCAGQSGKNRKGGGSQHPPPAGRRLMKCITNYNAWKYQCLIMYEKKGWILAFCSRNSECTPGFNKVLLQNNLLDIFKFTWWQHDLWVTQDVKMWHNKHKTSKLWMKYVMRPGRYRNVQ